MKKVKEKPLTRRERIVAMAKDKYQSDDEVEIDSNAKVSEGVDNGTYVQAWAWVDFEGTVFCKGDDGDHEECDSHCLVREPKLTRVWGMSTSSRSLRVLLN